MIKKIDFEKTKSKTLIVEKRLYITMIAKRLIEKEIGRNKNLIFIKTTSEKVKNEEDRVLRTKIKHKNNEKTKK